MITWMPTNCDTIHGEFPCKAEHVHTNTGRSWYHTVWRAERTNKQINIQTAYLDKNKSSLLLQTQVYCEVYDTKINI
jgi:hypothetical protein